MIKISFVAAVALALIFTQNASALPAGETPSKHLKKVRAAAANWQEDARLVQIYSGAVLQADGQLRCDIGTGIGWNFEFYSKAAGRFYYATVCGDEIRDVLTDEDDVELRNSPLKISRAIPDNFIDTAALAAIASKQTKRKECSSITAKLLYGQPIDHGAKFVDKLLWEVWYLCSDNKEESRRQLFDGKTGKPY